MMTLEDLIEELAQIREQHGGDVAVVGYTDGDFTANDVKVQYRSGCSCCKRPIVTIEV